MGQFRNLRFWRCVLAEFIGTLFTVLFTCGSMVLIRDTYVGSKECQFQQTRVLLDFVHSCVSGLIIMAMTWTLRDVSGGHVNPAVTAAMLITRKITLKSAVMYVIAQCTGAISACAILHALIGSQHSGVTSMSHRVYTAQGFGMEFCLTFLYVFTFFASVDRKRHDVPGPSLVAFGAAIIAATTFGVSVKHLQMKHANLRYPKLY